MAQNEKTYKTTIEVDTQEAAKNVDLLNKTVSTSLGEFDNLNEAISKTQDTLGKLDPKSEEFKELSKELSNLKDNLLDTEIQSSRFTEALAAQPGVIGLVGGSLEGLRGTFRVFMANPIIAVLAGITGAFLALRESLTRTEEGQVKLSKITSAFSKILNGLFAVIEPIAMAIADFTLSLLENEKVMDGISKTVGVLSGVFTGLLGTFMSVNKFIFGQLINGFKTLINVAKGAGDVLAGVFTFDWERIKEGASAAFDAVKESVSTTVENAKELGKGVADSVKNGFDAASENFKKGADRLTEQEKEWNEAVQAIRDEAYTAGLSERQKELYDRERKFQEDLKTLKENGVEDTKFLEDAYRKDVLEINKKYDEEELAQKKEQEQKILDAQKILTDATISMMSERDQELIAAETEYQEKLKQLQEAGIEDTTALTEAYNKQVLDINKQYDEEELQQQREQQQKLLENKAIENEQAFILEEQRRNQEIALINERERLGLISEEQASAERLRLQEERYQSELALIDEQTQLLLQNEELTELEKLQIVQDAEARKAELRQANRDDELLSIEGELANLATTFDRQRELIDEKTQLLLQQEGLTEEQRTQIKLAAAQERMAIDEMELQAQADIQLAQFDLLGQFGSFVSAIAGENKKLQIAGVVAEQAAAIGRILVNTSIANAKAVAASPLTFGQPWVTINTISGALGVASAVAAGVKAVQEINATEGPSVGGSAITSAPRPKAPSIGGGGGSIETPEVGGTTIPEVQGTAGGGNEGANQIAQVIAQATSVTQTEKPLKAYVVSTEISSQQALDRRTSVAATL